METILNFVYTGKIKFSSKNLEKIVRAADYFQLTIISDRCAGETFYIKEEEQTFRLIKIIGRIIMG